MKVLVISNMYPTPNEPYGTFIAAQVADLEAVGVEVALVVKRGRSRTGYPMFLTRSALGCLRGGWDVVHAHYGFHSAFIPLLMGAKPLVVTFHRGDAISEPNRNGLYRSLQRLVAARANHVICVSREVQEAVLALGAHPDRISRLTCGVDTTRFAPAADLKALRGRLGYQPGSPMVVFSGTLCRRKGVDLLIECARRLPYVSFVFVGEGPLNTGPGNCRFVGPVANSEMPLWLNAGDLYALPSRSEGTPVALLEAMACGLPVVCSDVGDCAEVVQDGRTGFVIPPEDVDALEARIRRLAGNPEMQRQMGEAARAYVCARLDGQVVARHLKGIYRRVLLERRSYKRRTAYSG